MTTSPWRLGARTLALCTAALLFPATVYAAQTASGSPGLSVWPPSPAVVAVAWPIVTGLASLLYTRLDATSRAHAIFAMLASVGLDLPTLGAMISKAVVGRFTLGMKARAAKIAGSALLLVALFAFLPGCSVFSPSPPVVPQTPDNASAIAGCQGIEQASNLFVVGDFGFTGSAAGLGAAAAAFPDSNGSAKTGLAMGAAASAGVAGLLTGLTAYERGRFASGQCQSYLGPLPATPFGAKPDGGAQ